MSNRLMLSLIALAFAPAAWSQQAPSERTIYMAAVEPKGGVTVDREAFPARGLPDGGGYILKKPDEKGRWEVSTYRWDPGTVVVNQGERVTLEIVGINGNQHSIAIPGYDVKGMVRRGEVARISFLADKPGLFKIVCASHMPSMQGELVVLPAR
jgi:plastocyanin